MKLDPGFEGLSYHHKSHLLPYVYQVYIYIYIWLAKNKVRNIMYIKDDIIFIFRLIQLKTTGNSTSYDSRISSYSNFILIFCWIIIYEFYPRACKLLEISNFLGQENVCGGVPFWNNVVCGRVNNQNWMHTSIKQLIIALLIGKCKIMNSNIMMINHINQGKGTSLQINNNTLTQ